MTARTRAAVLGVPLLSVLRRGDRDQVRDLTAGIHIEHAADAPGVDTDRLSRAVHGLAVQHRDSGLEQLASALARHCMQRVDGAVAAAAEVRARGWDRLELGGRPRDRDWLGGIGLMRLARVSIHADTERVQAGFRNLRLLSTAAAPAAGVLLHRLRALWSYGWAEIPFDTQWQQVRRALTEAYAERGGAAGGELAMALARAVLAESPPVHQIAVRLDGTIRRAVDLASVGMDDAAELFGAVSPARAVHRVVLTREEGLA